MTWEYRIMRMVGGKGSTHWYGYGIHGVYTDGKKLSWTQEPVNPYGDSVESLKEDLKMMSRALKKPVLDHKTGKEVK